VTYQPYPTSGGAASEVPQRPVQPASIRAAVWLMWAGAVLGLLGLIFTLVFSGRIKKAVRKAALKAAQIHTLETVTVSILAAVLLVGVLLWVWMALANGRGYGWARIVATVLFGLNTLYLIFAAGRAVTTAIFVAIGWLIGLAAIVLLWRRESSAYINLPQR
jgi:hypothetical protein